MTDPFQDRLREAIVEPADVDVEGLRRAVRNVGKKRLPRDGLGLVRMAHGIYADASDEAIFRRTLSEHAGSVVIDGGRQLISVLALCTLVEAFSRKGVRTALPAALAVRSAAYQAWRVVHPDLLSYADLYLGELATVTRQPMSSPDEAVRATRLPVEASEGDGDAIRSRLDRTVEVVDALRGALRALTQTAEVDEEQRGLVWWLLSSHDASSPSVAAIELAELTRLIPGPRAADELLRARLQEPPTAGKLASGAGGVPPSLPASVPRVRNEIADFCATLMALEQGDEANGDSRNGVAAARGLYDQILLVRAFEEARSR